MGCLNGPLGMGPADSEWARCAVDYGDRLMRSQGAEGRSEIADEAPQPERDVGLSEVVKGVNQASQRRNGLTLEFDEGGVGVCQSDEQILVAGTLPELLDSVEEPDCSCGVSAY